MRRELREAADRAFEGVGPRGRSAHGRSTIDHARAAIVLGAGLHACGDEVAGDEMLARLK